MISRWPTVPQGAAGGLRYALAVGAGGAILLLLWLCWLRPLEQQAQRMEQQMRSYSARYQQQLKLLLALPPLSALQRQLASLEDPATAERTLPFSLPGLLDASGGVLTHWQPGERHDELALTLQWTQFLQLLNYLVGLKSAIAIPAMSLQGPSPQLQLRLELNHEN